MTRGGSRPGAGRKKNGTPKFGEWVSVEDRLPEKSDHYLVSMNGLGVREDLFIPDGPTRKWYRYYQYDITAWMPLPPPPTK